MSTPTTARYAMRVITSTGHTSTIEGTCTHHQYSKAIAALHGVPHTSQKFVNQRDSLLEALTNLVIALDRTTWSSWQSTARFDDELKAARHTIDVVGGSLIVNDLRKSEPTTIQVKPCTRDGGGVTRCETHEAQFFGVYIGRPGEYEWVADFHQATHALLFANAVCAHYGHELEDNT